jgi:hypothetical protein
MKFEIAPKSTEIQANWDDAKLYCFSLTIDGKTGWRLPTKEELGEISQLDSDLSTAIYWSSACNDKGAWCSGDFSGHPSKYYSFEYDGAHVRPVRDT